MKRRRDARARGRSRARALWTALTLAALALATAASAHHGEPATGEDEPGTLGADNTAGTLSTDFENFSGVQTPVAKDGAAAGWQQIAGSLWREDGTITDMARPSPGLDSPTPYDFDFYGLGFLKVEIAQNAGLSAAAASNEAKANGFAVGAQCRRNDPEVPMPAEEVLGCERVPVIYRYQDHPTEGLIWEQSYPGPDDKAKDPGGFVAAVAWLTPYRALAVGGTGTYPRREVERVPGEPDNAEGDAAYAKRDACQGLAPGEPCRGAGMARAWIFEKDPESADPKLRQGTWRELQNKPDPEGGFTGQDGDELPDEMRALHAIDASPRPADCLSTLDGKLPQAECAIVGGMRQLWHFADGSFVRGYGPKLGTPPGEGIFEGNTVNPVGGTSSAANFRFRVRDIRFAPQTWRIGNDAGFEVPAPAVGTPSPRAWAVTSGCCSADTANDRPARLSLGASGWSAFRGGPAPVGVNDRDGAVEQALGRSVLNPDSYYALTVLRRRKQGEPDRLADFKLRTPGGPSERYHPREPPSRFTCYSTSNPPEYCDSERFAVNNETKLVSSLRLVSADGDMAGSNPNGVGDWAVGVLRSSGRGVAYSTVGTPCQAPGQDEKLVEAEGAPSQVTGNSQGLVTNEGVSTLEAFWAKWASKNLCSLPSYALNAYRVAGEDPLAGDEGTGWAVGDHGAVVTRGGGVAGVEAPPARQGARSAPQPLSRDAFERHRAAATDEPGPVPALAPGTVAVEPGFHEGQSPTFPSGVPAKLIVMSRDGSEGWAFGFSVNGSDSYRYDGLRWTRCDPEGIAGLVPPDPACAEAPPAASVKAVERVPLERDSDPTNDEELEAVALAGSAAYRYREGRWTRDETHLSEGLPASLHDVDVAFTAPDDGWAVRPVRADNSGAQSTEIDVRHFDGEGWVQCTDIGFVSDPEWSAPEECDDDAGRLRVRGLCSGGSARLAIAGERVYLYTTRDLGPRSTAGGSSQPCLGAQPEPYPVILYRDRGGEWTGGVDETPNDSTYNPTDGGWDPGCASGSGTSCVATPESGHQGGVAALSVTQDADSTFQGWAVGVFGGSGKSARALIMRLSDGHDVVGAMNRGAGAWRNWTVRDGADDYLRYPLTKVAPEQLLTLPAEAGPKNAFMFLSGSISTRLDGATSVGRPPALAFDQMRRRWAAIPTPWQVSNTRTVDAEVQALAPDGRGGFWAAGERFGAFHHYTDRVPKPVFTAVPDPAAGRARLTALGAGADGTVWVGDANGGVYRYDRLAGWSARVEVPGWDPARASRRAGVNAIAVGPDGEGVAVGDGGRIATLGAEVRLDPAATIGCDPQAPVAPCGTGNDLLAAAVAPDGSAIVAGERRTLLWRPAGGDFRPPAGVPPRVPAATPIVDVEMPLPERAYLLAGGNRVIRGEMSAPGVWSWHIEVGDTQGTPDPLTASDGFPGHASIADLAIDASGRGYAVGGSGVILQRTGDGESSWRRIPNSDRSPLNVIALPAGGGEGALAGGFLGRILTLVGGRFEVARHADPFDPLAYPVAELALTPGYAAGEAEAWALLGRGDIGGRSALLHYPAGPADQRLDPSRGLAPLRDIPAPTPGEIAFAVFGKQDCEVSAFARQRGNDVSCGPPDGSNETTADLVNRRIREELATRAEEEAKPRFALFTGDAVDRPGGGEALFVPGFGGSQYARAPLALNLKHRRWVEIVADPLTEQGFPTFGAIGGLDVAPGEEWCTTQASLVQSFGTCPQRRFDELRDQLGAQSGLSLPWRATMASMPAPWEREQEARGLRFERVGAGALSQRGPAAATPAVGTAELESVTVPHPLIPGSTVNDTRVRARAGSYRLDAGDTHYSVDVIEEATDEKVARIVVVDTSMRSIAASDPQQHPIEAGGQLRWLEEVLCFEGSAEDTDGDVRDCTREEGQQAIVLSNTPTYSYGPISPEETQTDAAAFEAILLKNRVNVVVSGRLGWNGRYWTLAPGVHAPCPGQDYRSDSSPPSLANPEICGASTVGGTQDVVPDPNQVIDELPEDAKQAAGLAGRGAIPFVVSSTAGGRFNEKAVRGGFATAENGFWRGYSIVRLHPSGDPAQTIVEQRPILDWVGLSAHDPVLAPGGRLQLQSFAREAFGLDTAPRYYEIPETQVITHRYHLLLADPGEPWRACEASDATCEAFYSKLAEGPRSFDSASSEAARSAQDDNVGASASGSGSAQDDNEGASASATAGNDAGACEPYLCLPERVGTIDPDTGDVRAGNGKYPDTFAIATLSVGRHVAAQPLVFTKSPSFVVNPAASLAEVPPPPTETGTASAPPPPPGSPVPTVQQPGVPSPPPVPPIAPPQAAEPPEPQPPSPPVPPPPSEAPAPISLTLAPPGIAIATPTAVIQPPTPPVNPAPPGGARREARQRQAATQKSGADSGEGGSEGVSDAVDTASGPRQAEGASMTRRDTGADRHAFARRDRERPGGSFTPLARADQPSAWTQGALYGGGITLMALALSLACASRGTGKPRGLGNPSPAAATVGRSRRQPRF